jgi:hypothetical protein
MVVSKYKALKDWLSDYIGSDQWIDFNTSEANIGNTSLNTVTGDTKLKEYVDGSYDAALTFSISVVKMYDTEQSDLNMDAMDEMTELMSWIDDDTPSLPDFGEGYIVTDVSILDITPAVDVMPDSALAVYTFYGKVYYTRNV